MNLGTGETTVEVSTGQAHITRTGDMQNSAFARLLTRAPTRSVGLQGGKMALPAAGWKNKVGTKDRACRCGTWKQHWVNYSEKPWPTQCTVSGCSNNATLGAHVINANVNGERIAALCASCNGLTGTFSFSGTVLPSANTAETCK